MQVTFTTTQNAPLYAGATEVFAALGIMLTNPATGVTGPWDLTAGSASMLMTPPTGNPTFALSGVISTNNVTFTRWTATPGEWSRREIFSDSTGFTQLTEPFPFTVQE
jgi:hypothetical protein